MDNDTCPIEECGKPTRGNSGLCYGHYMKNWRYGTPTPDHGLGYRDITGQRFGMLVVEARVDGKWQCICDCGRSTIVPVGSLNRGSAKSCGLTKHRRLERPTYRAAHDRVKRMFGPARNHSCIDCGGAAAQWSYDHEDPAELTWEGMPYSTSEHHYHPRCISCHKLFDLHRHGQQ